MKVGKLLKGILPYLIDVGKDAFLSETKRRYERGEVSEEYLLNLANVFEAVAEELRGIAGGSSLMDQVRKRAKKVEIRESEPDSGKSRNGE